MPKTIKLIDEKVETLFTRQDFECLIDEYMGCEATQYFRDLIDEIKASYNEQIDDIEEYCDGQIDELAIGIDELTTGIKSLRKQLAKLKEVTDDDE